MKIINFYSFKGGVGRSLSLANVAYQLGQKGQRVGLLDLDVEAGGLNHILKVSANTDRDLLALLEPNNRDVTNLEEYVHEIRFRKNEVPRIFLLPTITDSQLLDRIVWNEATQHFISDALIPAFAKQYELDYILIDSRSGLSQFAALGLKTAHLEVLVCRLDAQNRYGIRRMIEVCRGSSKPFKIVVSACPEEKRAQHLRRFEREIGISVDFILPYVSDLYYEEFLISKRKPSHRLAKQYLALTNDIHNQSS